MVNGPFKTGNEPTSITIDPRGIYIYVANSLDETVSAYSISLPTGTPPWSMPPQRRRQHHRYPPVSIIVEPALGRYVYTANYLGNSISGFKPQSRHGRASTPGHALSHRRQSHGDRCDSAWQPCPAGNHAVAESVIHRIAQPVRLGFLIESRD